MDGMQTDAAADLSMLAQLQYSSLPQQASVREWTDPAYMAAVLCVDAATALSSLLAIA